MKRATASGREALIARVPESIRRRLGPGASYLHMLVFDHLFVRVVLPNRSAIAEGVWRSAQPLPRHVRQMRRLGVRTVINLRGPTKTMTYPIEQAACAREGITLVNFKMESRRAPSRETILAARELFMKAEHPLLIHCKAGADRAGLMSALYLHFKLGVPISEARSQLSLRYGHFRQLDTGVLDAVLDRYIADNAKTPMPFIDWVQTTYDADELQRSFKANLWINRIVNVLLRRE